MITKGTKENRAIQFRASSVDKELRTVEASISSTAPVARPWGHEVLDHSPAAVDFSRLMDGALPLLVNHDQSRLNIGLAKDFRLDGEKIRATLVFGEGQTADEVFANVQNGTVRGISIGYMIEEWEENTETVTVTRWTPFEVSIVSIPADTSVGIGRAFEVNGAPVAEQIRAYVAENNFAGILDHLAEQATAQKWPADRFQRKAGEILSKPEEQTRIIEVRKFAKTEEVDDNLTRQALRHGWTLNQLQDHVANIDARIYEAGELASKPQGGRALTLWKRAILSIAGDKCPDEAAQFIATGTGGLDDFRQHILDTKFNATPVGVYYEEERQMDEYTSKIKQFSFTRAILASLNNDFSKAGLEREIMQEAARQSGKKFRSNTLCLPLEVFASRALSVGTATAGGNLVATEFSGFIDPLRNALLIARLGAQILTGLQGNVAIPRQTGTATATWVAESGAGTPSDQTFDQVALSPKTVIGLTRFSRRLAEQATPAIEQIIKNDLLATIATEIDRVAIAGTGANNQPRGILNTSGIGAVAGGTNGAAPTWQNIVDLTAAIANANADSGELAFLTNSKVRAKLMATTKGTYLPFIWEEGKEQNFGSVAGFKAGVTNQVPSNLTKGTANGICSAIVFGNFTDVMIGQWGAIEAEIDPYTYFSSGDLQARVIADVDVAVRNAGSFAAMQDALTA